MFLKYEARTIIVEFVIIGIDSTQRLCVGIYSLGEYFNSESEPIRAVAKFVVLADAVFEISSFSVKKYFSGLWSVCRVNHLSCRIYFNPDTTKTVAIASRSLSE